MYRALFALTLVASSLGFPVAAAAQDGVTLGVNVSLVCSQATFESTASGGSGVFDLAWVFGDAQGVAEDDIAVFPHLTLHDYAVAGTYAWALQATDSADPTLTGSALGSVQIGPAVALTSDPFPPLLTLEGSSASASFTAAVTGGTPPYTFAWDLDGDGSADPSGPTTETAQATFTTAGHTTISVWVTDDCGLTQMASIDVVVVDPDEVCHPMAQRIADAVNTLFPSQSAQLYTCLDVYDFFAGGWTGSQLGFGRMWKAYQLATQMEELTWEQIVQWHLDVGGWGLLMQLDRFAETLGDVPLVDLYTMVVGGETSIQDALKALRLAARLDADFADTLARLEAGASPGELNQLYQLADELGMGAAELDAYLVGGASIQDLRAAVRVAGSTGVLWQDVLGMHESGQNWGAIRQALRLADEDTSAAQILEMGIGEFRREMREAEQANSRQTRELEQLERTAARLAAQYGTTSEAVLTLYSGACASDWGCVRKYFHDLASPHGPGEDGPGNGGGNGNGSGGGKP
jgi:PKD repeat protein